MAKSGEVDWLPIKIEYITTRTSFTALSRKYGVARKNISDKATQDGWKAEKQRYIDTCFAKAAESLSTDSAGKLEKLIRATTKAVDVALEALEDDKQLRKYIITERDDMGAEHTSEYEFTKVDTKALKDLTGVIKDLTGLMRDFYGIPTQAQAQAQRIAAERLEMDKRKADAGASTDKTIEVVLSDELEEYAK